MTDNSGDNLTPVRVYRPEGGVTEYSGPVRQAPAFVPPRQEQTYHSQPTEAAAVPAAATVTAQTAHAVPEQSYAPIEAPAGPTYWVPPLALMIVAGGLVALLSMGIRSIVPLWQTPMLTDLAWTSTQFSIAIATQNLLWGLFSPIFGGLADKYGSHKVLIFGAVLQAGGLWVMSTASTPATFFLSAGLMLGIAQSAAGMGIVLGAIGKVVKEEHRTTAFGVITAASSAGMIVLTPIGRALLENLTWSEAFVWISILSLPMIVLAFLIRSGRNADNLSTAGVANQTIGGALTEALSHKGYILLTVGFFVCGFHVTFIGVHLPKYLNDLGLGWQLGAEALMIIGVFNVAACLAVGPLAGKFSKRGILAMIYLGRAAVFLGFLMLPPSEITVYVFAATLGVLWLSTVPPTQGLVAQMFGTKYMTMLFGVVFLSHQLGSFLGVTLGAAAFDYLGSYDLVWYACVALGLIAALFHIFIDERSVARMQPDAPQPAE
jgi:predicted MFS family arabinose efflux permease